MTLPCFPIYALFVEAEGRRPVFVDTPDMTVDADAYVAAIDADTRVDALADLP